MRKVQLVLFILITINLTAQIDSNLFHQCLKDKLLSNFIELDSIIKKTKKQGGVSLYMFNDIVDNYQGGEIVIYDSEEWAYSYNVCRIKTISKGDSIIYYEFENFVENQYGQTPWFNQLMFSASKLYMDKIEFSKLGERFQEITNSKFSKNDFFEPSPTFGQDCSEGAVDPPEMIKVKKLISSKDTLELKKYLASSNTSKQVYGYYGFHMLTKGNYIPSSDIIYLLNMIANKKGIIPSCMGCDFTPQEIRSIIENINQL